MHTAAFIERATQAVVEYVNDLSKHNADIRPIRPEDVGVIWAGRVLANNQGILYTDDLLFRVTYDGARDETGVTVYKSLRTFMVTHFANSIF